MYINDITIYGYICTYVYIYVLETTRSPSRALHFPQDTVNKNEDPPGIQSSETQHTSLHQF